MTPDAIDRLADDELIARCREELPYNTAAFEVLLRRHEPGVFETCLRYLGSEADAEEVTQDVFLRVFHALPRFEGRAAFRTWLYRITQNQCATRYAKLKRRAEAREQYRANRALETAEHETAQDDRDLIGPVGEAMDHLSPSDREVLILRHVSGLPLQEVADVLGISLSAAKMRLYRAEERFRTAHSPDPPPAM